MLQGIVALPITFSDIWRPLKLLDTHPWS